MENKEIEKISCILKFIRDYTSDVELMRLFQRTTFQTAANYYDLPKNITHKKIIKALYLLHPTKKERFNFMKSYGKRNVWSYSAKEKKIVSKFKFHQSEKIFWSIKELFGL